MSVFCLFFLFQGQHAGQLVTLVDPIRGNSCYWDSPYGDVVLAAPTSTNEQGTEWRLLLESGSWMETGFGSDPARGLFLFSPHAQGCIRQPLVPYEQVLNGIVGRRSMSVVP